MGLYLEKLPEVDYTKEDVGIFIRLLLSSNTKNWVDSYITRIVCDRIDYQIMYDLETCTNKGLARHVELVLRNAKKN